MRRRPMRNVLLILLTAAAPFLGAWANAEVDAPTADAKTAEAKPVYITGARQLDFKSTVNGRTYRVKIAVPRSRPPTAGYPVLYVLDGESYFGTFVEIVRQLSAVRAIEAAVVVGITYPIEEEALTRRMYDLSPTPLPQDESDSVKEMPADAEFGGADSFYEVVDREIKTRVAVEANVDPARSTLFGWSLGGLYVLHILFTHPEAFQTYAALSPSIWWNHQAVLKEMPEFERRVRSGGVAPRIFIGVGGLEQTVPKGTLPPGFTRRAIEKELRSAQMVNNVERTASRLGALKGSIGYQIRSRIFQNETHNSVPWVAARPILEFAMPISAAIPPTR
jgi:uncharacterized protein